MRKTVLISLGALVALAALFVACGGSDDKGGNGSGDQAQNIRIGKGLTVANLSSDRSASTGSKDSLALTQGGAGAAAPAVENSSSRNAAPGYAGVGSSGSGVAPQQSTNQTANTGITVQGYGSATADADSAVVEFGFGSNGGVTPLPYPIAENGSTSPDVKPSLPPSGTGTASPITKATLQPVIDALVGAGVAAGDIELLNQGYYDPYYSNATLRATIKNISAVDGAVAAAQTAASNISGVYLQSTNVSYSLNDCTALERAAVKAAVEDAGDRAAVLAGVLSVTLGKVSGASDYSWYQSGTGCGSNNYSPYPMAYTPWKSGGTGSGTVQVVSNISVTYAFQ